MKLKWIIDQTMFRKTISTSAWIWNSYCTSVHSIVNVNYNQNNLHENTHASNRKITKNNYARGVSYLSTLARRRRRRRRLGHLFPFSTRRCRL